MFILLYQISSVFLEDVIFFRYSVLPTYKPKLYNWNTVYWWPGSTHKGVQYVPRW